MLAFDIETTGLDRFKDKITVISLYDPSAGIEEVLRFVELKNGEVVYRENYPEIVGNLVQKLDDATYLCAFNGTNFDLPYIQCAFSIPNETVQKWVLKTHDVLEVARRGFNRTFNLNMALELNKVGSGGKTGSGMEAVHQAHRGDWDDLARYCLDDSILTHQLSSLPVINCPENWLWRKHNGVTHDPARVLQIYTKDFPRLTFGYGPVHLEPTATGSGV